jgi:hypothetical protein
MLRSLGMWDSKRVQLSELRGLFRISMNGGATRNGGGGYSEHVRLQISAWRLLLNIHTECLY